MAKIHEVYDFSLQKSHKHITYSTEQDPTDNTAVMVSLELPGERRWQKEESLNELQALCGSYGLIVKREFINRRDKPSPSCLVGSGTIEHIKEYCIAAGIKNVIFDDDLTPAQMKNIIKMFDDKIRPMDRTELIIDIFAQRAKTKEGKLQIELARLEYILPRLTRQWAHLIHQAGVVGGGVGVRGPGEKQLEMDRRQIRHRITAIKRELKTMVRYRSVQRKRRERHNIPVLAIIGYTNAGKSTLLNALTNAGAIVEDKLFATLDPTSRKFLLPDTNQEIVLSDTVGFIRKLPHELVDAFKATLEEVRYADILIHVLDVSDDKAEDRTKVVLEVLQELKADDKPVLTVLNKIDMLDNRSFIDRFKRDSQPCVAISARSGEGFRELFTAISDLTCHHRVEASLRIPHDQHKLLSLLYQKGRIYERKDCDDAVYVYAEYDVSLNTALEPFHVDDNEISW
ncbi:MAG: GTPase HflX [Candidatus Auribacterota bacterium]